MMNRTAVNYPVSGAMGTAAGYQSVSQKTTTVNHGVKQFTKLM